MPSAAEVEAREIHRFEKVQHFLARVETRLGQLEAYDNFANTANSPHIQIDSNPGWLKNWRRMARRTRLGRSTQRLSSFGPPWKMNNKQIKDLDMIPHIQIQFVKLGYI